MKRIYTRDRREFSPRLAGWDTVKIVRKFPECVLCKSWSGAPPLAHHEGMTLFGVRAYMCERCYSEFGIEGGQLLMVSNHPISAGRRLPLAGGDRFRKIKERGGKV